MRMLDVTGSTLMKSSRYQSRAVHYVRSSF